MSRLGINLRAGVHGIQLEHSDQCVGSGLHGGIAAVAPQSYQCVKLGVQLVARGVGVISAGYHLAGACQFVYSDKFTHNIHYLFDSLLLLQALQFFDLLPFFY